MKLDLDPDVDLPLAIDHWCRDCQRVHVFVLHLHSRCYRSLECPYASVTFIQLCAEGRLIEGKWKGIERNRRNPL